MEESGGEQGLPCGMQSLPLLMKAKKAMSGSQAFWQLDRLEHVTCLSQLCVSYTSNQGLVHRMMEGGELTVVAEAARTTAVLYFGGAVVPAKPAIGCCDQVCWAAV